MEEGPTPFLQGPERIYKAKEQNGDNTIIPAVLSAELDHISLDDECRLSTISSVKCSEPGLTL
jgi:hypothetical protein